MKGKINSGQLVTAEPLQDRELTKGDVVLCRVRNYQYLHLIKGIRGNKYQIGNNIGGIKGWINSNAIFGICTKVED